MTPQAIDDMKCLTVKELRGILAHLPDEVEVWQATDEEGNSYSPVTLRGFSYEPKGFKTARVIAFPLLPQYED